MTVFGEFGEGALRFEYVPDWEKRPEGISYIDVPAVCADSELNVYAFCRGDVPVMVFDRDGRLIDTWGAGMFSPRTHGMYMTSDDALYLSDEGGNSVARYSLDGRFRQQVGPLGPPSDSGYDGVDETTIVRGAPPFNRPTNVAVGPRGDLYVTDGYGNSRVHRFTPAGDLELSWGEPGSGPGQFRAPHSLWVHADGRVLVVDRDNDRIQVFDPDGIYLTQWTDLQRPHDIAIDDHGLVYVCESFRAKGSVSYRRGVIPADETPRISIFDLDGNLLARWGEPDLERPGALHSPHGLWVDREGSIYVANNITAGARSRGVVGRHGIQKFARL